MLLFVLRRIALSVVLLFVMSVVIFGLIQFMPGDVLDIVLQGISLQSIGKETVADLRHELGLDLPVYEQYANWIAGVLQGDFGKSLVMRVPIGPMVWERLKSSLVLAVPATFLMVVLGIGLGIVAAVREKSWIDHVVAYASLTAIATPSFVVGTIFVYVFAVQLNWIPAAFNTVDLSRVSVWGMVGFFFSALVFPCLTIAFEQVAHVLRQARGSMIEELKTDYVRMAVLKGMSRHRVIYVHALRNALLPAITVIAINIGYIISGVIVVETVFSYPGIGSLMVMAIKLRDVPLMLAVMIVISAAYVFANLFADIIYLLTNPRLRQ
jgi:peptide/nickel transport system permease protein